jgi:hypothetical protein
MTVQTVITLHLELQDNIPTKMENRVMLKEDHWTGNPQCLWEVALEGERASRTYQEQQQLLETEIDGELPDVYPDPDYMINTNHRFQPNVGAHWPQQCPNRGYCKWCSKG